MQRGGLVAFAYLGAKHMVTGYDHLLFLFSVIFFELKTTKAIFTVKITAETKFERDNKPAERAPLKKGDRIGVERVRSASREVVAKRIVLGLPTAASDH